MAVPVWLFATATGLTTFTHGDWLVARHFQRVTFTFAKANTAASDRPPAHRSIWAIRGTIAASH
ncbi:MAG: hypothetical protein AAFX01_13555 [Cyanobacteria bacterium J06638_28]